MSTETILILLFGGMEAIATVGCAYFTWQGNKRTTEIQNATEARQKPLEVRMDQALHQQFASKSEFHEHVRDNDRQRGILHKRMDETIRDYNEKFQALPNEIVALLRNTGNLK